jgi:type IV pilus assembly protein PilY1
MEIDSACTSSVSGLTNATDIAAVPSESTANAESFKGWYINLDASSTGLGAERVITDPLTTSTGLVFFTSSKPYTDVCAIGGKSFIWVTRYNTGGAPTSLKGVALLQVSTAAIEQINLATAFTEKGGRRTTALEGLPPTQQGLSLLSTPPPVKRTIHIRER